MSDTQTTSYASPSRQMLEGMTVSELTEHISRYERIAGIGKVLTIIGLACLALSVIAILIRGTMGILGIATIGGSAALVVTGLFLMKSCGSTVNDAKPVLRRKMNARRRERREKWDLR